MRDKNKRREPGERRVDTWDKSLFRCCNVEEGKKKKQEGAAEVFELLILGTQLSHPKKASEGVRACSPSSLV